MIKCTQKILWFAWNFGGVSHRKTRSCRLHGCKILRSKILVGWSTFGEEIKRIPSPKKFFAKKIKISRFKVNRNAIFRLKRRIHQEELRKLSTSRLFHCFIWKNVCEKWSLKIFAPESQIEIEKIDTQTVWKAEKRLKLFPWVVTKSKLFEKEFVWSKKKRRIEKFYLQTTLKSWKEAF